MRQIARAFVALLACASLITACAPTATSSAAKTHEVQLTVHVEGDGTILLDGRPAGIEELQKRLVSVKQNGGAVLYSRSNPSGEPPPNAMKVLKALMDAKVPIQMLAPPTGDKRN